MKCAICGEEVVDLTAGCPLCDGPTANKPPDPAAGRTGEQAPSDRFSPGTVLAGRYRLVCLLGRGGMGEVYRADDLRLDQQVALKFLAPAREQDPAMRERFLDEVRLARRISHANVCRVYDVGETGGRLFLSMEYVDGEDLRTLLKRIGRPPRERAAEMSVRICRGLAAIHAQGILYRDLKPANVMIDGDGRPRLTDFGLAALADSVQG
ncbi:MAG: serine/threonine protein kinase, partial [bacterium]|nr:serine/threonine protein kinase [bacterium]